MAFDQALLEGMSRGLLGIHTRILRLYSWHPWTISLGRFQKERSERPEIGSDPSQGPIQTVRRRTGGRAVLHADEITYSIVISYRDPLFSSSVLGTYKNMAKILLEALSSLGAMAEITPARARETGGAARRSDFCFSSPGHYELTWKGLKIAGSAQVRVPGSVLQHGSLPLTIDDGVHGAFMEWCGTIGAPTDFMASLTMAAGRTIEYTEAATALKAAYVKDCLENSIPVEYPAEMPAWLMDEAGKMEPSFSCADSR